jgi:phosphoribosylformylglycinamidine synthase
MIEPTVNLELAIELGMTSDEYNRVLDKIGRVPTFTELGIISVMWSEHASYKNSIKYLKQLPKDGPAILVKAGEENAGVVDIGDGMGVAFKIESHNHPSAVEPYHGAATGVGGILRDIFTMGARPICALNSLRFGEFDDPHVQKLLTGVIDGIADYGNIFGVPTVGGEIYFEDAYAGNPLVNAMVVGIVDKQNLISASAKGVGNYVVYAGKKTGRDGVGGSSFASAELTDETNERPPNVPQGDPHAEKQLFEATIETIEKKLLVGIQDMGAAGLTCTTSEMSAKAGLGIEIELSLVPVVDDAMTPYEIMLSESQERMLLVVEPDKYADVKAIFEKWNLHVEKIGTVTDDQLLRVKQHGDIKAELPSKFLVLGGDAPVYDREFSKPKYLEETSDYDQDELPYPDDFNQVLQRLLNTPNIASKSPYYKKFDSTAMGNTIIGPGGDAALVRIPNTKKAVSVSTDCNGRHCYLDTYEGTKGAVAEAARNIICTGAKPLAISNNLNFGNPYKPDVYWNFINAIRGMSDACRMFETPVTGGNVSFYNENPKTAIYPTPTIFMVGLLDDIDKAITSEFKAEGDVVYLLGQNCNETGGSEYQKLLINKPMGMPPIVNLDRELILQKTMLYLVNKRLLRSAHDCSDGGLAVAIAESCLNSQNLGCKINIMLKHRADFELFGEAHSRIVVSIDKNDTEIFENICLNKQQHFLKLGVVTSDGRVIVNDLIDLSLR